MPADLVVTSLLIVLARVTDVSLGTLRTVSVVHGRRGVAFALGFVEILIWIAVVSQVITNLDEPVYALSYALGFGLGNFVGITVEGWFAAGKQVLRVFTRTGEAVAEALRDEGFVVTRFEGVGREGPITLLFLETERKRVGHAIRLVRQFDPGAFYIVDDIRMSSGTRVRYHEPSSWRAVLKRR